MVDHVTAHRRGLLFAAMGAGKTSSVLTALSDLELVEAKQPALVLAPKLVAATTWPNELAKWQHLEGKRAVVIAGTADQRLRALRDSAADIYTCSYDNLPWLVDTIGADWPWRNVVADEVTKVKSFRLGGKGSVRGKALARVAHSRVDRFVGLTGTPAPNGLQDLWAQMWFIDKGERLGRTYTAFIDRWFRKGYNGFSIEPLDFAQAQIEDAIRDVCLTINPADYMSIDDPIVVKVEVELPPRVRAMYREMEQKMFLELREDVEIEAVNAAARSMKCLQITSGFLFTDADATAYDELHSAKLDALEQILDEANGMPVVVAYHFKPSLARLKKRFPYGKTKEELGDNIEKEWNSGRYPLLFAHPASLGHGLNLQDAGNILAFYDVQWNLEEHQQIIERIGPLRQVQAGHPRAVYLYYLLCKNTIDELVYTRLDTKRTVQSVLLEAMKEKLT